MSALETRMARRNELQRELTYWWQMIPVEDMAKIVEQAEDAIAQALEKMRDLPDAAADAHIAQAPGSDGIAADMRQLDGVEPRMEPYVAAEYVAASLDRVLARALGAPRASW